MFRVVSAQSFWLLVVSALGCFGLGRVGPGSFRPILMGRFSLNFFKSPRLRIIGRTIIWLFDEESIVMSFGCLMKSLWVS